MLIVDDESLARKRIRSLLKRERHIDVLGECATGEQAVAAIETHQPDLVFLDVQMPELDGFGVLEKLKSPLPLVVFVTAYDQYALQAFDASALDYLLKPFEDDRFYQTLQRATRQLQLRQNDEIENQLRNLLQQHKQPRYLKHVVVKGQDRALMVPVENIQWIESAANYVRVYHGNTSHLIRETMGRLEAKLDPDTFIRIHRSTILNLNYLKEFQPMFKGEYVAILHNGQRLKMSRSCRERLRQKLDYF